MSNLGKKIKKRRLKLRWTLDELAQKSRVSKAYLSQLETGESERPSAEVLYNIAIALKTSIAELLDKKLRVEERDRSVPMSLERAATENKWSKGDIKMLLGVAMRAKKNKKDLSPKDWAYLYETIKRVTRK